MKNGKTKTGEKEWACWRFMAAAEFLKHRRAFRQNRQVSGNKKRSQAFPSATVSAFPSSGKVASRDAPGTAKRRLRQDGSRTDSA